jgi:hypothetical protein
MLAGGLVFAHYNPELAVTQNKSAKINGTHLTESTAIE